MTDDASHHTPKIAKRAGRSAIGRLSLRWPRFRRLLIASRAAGIVSLLQWPLISRSTRCAGVLPITVGGVCSRAAGLAIRYAAATPPRLPGSLDLAFLCHRCSQPPSFARPLSCRTRPARSTASIFLTIDPQSTAVAPNDRVRTMYPRYPLPKRSSTAGRPECARLHVGNAVSGRGP